MSKVSRSTRDESGKPTELGVVERAEVRQLDSNYHFVGTRFALYERGHIIAIMEGSESYISSSATWMDGFVATDADEYAMGGTTFRREHWHIHV